MKYSEYRIKVSSNRKKDEENCRIWLKGKTRFQFQVKGKRQTIPIKHIVHDVIEGNNCIEKIKNALIDLDDCYDTLEKIQESVESKIKQSTIKTLKSKVINSVFDDLQKLPENKTKELRNLIESLTSKNADLEIAIRDKEYREQLYNLLKDYYEKLDLKQFHTKANLEFIKELYGEESRNFLMDVFKFRQNELPDEPSDSSLGEYKWSGLINIYLDIIYSFAIRYKLDPYLLYRKVLIHELAHAFHHRGIDATGGIWDSFGNSYPERKKVVEGLANWHCMHYMIKLDVETHSVENLYTLLCCSKIQPKVYRQYIKWSSYSFENIRNRIYHARKENKGMLSFTYFDSELNKCHSNGE